MKKQVLGPRNTETKILCDIIDCRLWVADLNDLVIIGGSVRLEQLD